MSKKEDGRLHVRECIDDSGDYQRKTYDVLNTFSWGYYIIAGDIDNPHDANMFSASKEMLNAMIRCAINLEENKGSLPATIWKSWSELFIPIIEKAKYPMKWTEIKEEQWKDR